MKDMDREPFAKFLRGGVGLEDRAVIGGITFESYGRVTKADVDILNIVFNKRLDEEIAKERERCIKWLHAFAAYGDNPESLIKYIREGE